ncbi:glycosyltransferase family 1 protein [Desulfurobacterium sp.]|uniref:glycosyltransferase family 4 protein n=1 Tax=Desulfurobacterium sp. TaxID=2004706 RepID=UPI0026124765|nr:glycosyltransferase family 1 protein [Desulfurobacterium sp.]
MKLAIFKPHRMPLSIANYIDNVLENFPEYVKFYFFFTKEEIRNLRDEVDIYWFPNCAGGSFPSVRLLTLIEDEKVVVTLHGAAPFTVSPRIYYPTVKSLIKGELYKWMHFMKWQIYKDRISKIITVSNYAKEEICSKLLLPKDKVCPIYHGVNLNIFNEYGSMLGQGDYFLHVSQYQPKKNVDRIIEAYIKIPEPKAKFVLVLPGYKKEIKNENIVLIKAPKTHGELAVLYRNAIAFVFPSLHESFGMSILEAMACGCPVITSNISACAEIAGNAALLVNPYSIGEISNAMRRLMEDSQLRKDLSERGIKRAKKFTWKESAMNHLKVFEGILKGIK